ncbi:maltokinase [Streptomyces sp. NPDC005438]|uniref:maltokinase N-terminal cap-like domain-containing protein n=1 Tax=Streptomyces sp. NPDC005438 TaxID=3156880 RepID=UPI0033B0C559
MSDRTPSGATTETSTALRADPPAPPTGPHGALLRSLAPLLAEWLPRQRWFAGKGHPILGFHLVSVTELLPPSSSAHAPGLLHLLVRARQPQLVTEDGAPTDCYQLLLGLHPAPPSHLAPAVIGRPRSGPLRGLTVYEGLQDARLSSVLLERLRAPGTVGDLRFVREPGSAIGSGLRPRPLAADQSNSSVVFGTSHILKLFRRVGPGLNPDLELPLALARTGSRRVPAPTAWCEARPTPALAPTGTDASGSAPDVPAPPHSVPTRPLTGHGAPGGRPSEAFTLGVLQPFVPRAVDGWRLALDALHSGEGFETAAHALGRATAEVHAGLAAALPTTELGPEQRERLASDMARRLASACEVVPELRPHQAGLTRALAALTCDIEAGPALRAQRIHGDLHLGQVLCSWAGDAVTPGGPDSVDAALTARPEGSAPGRGAAYGAPSTRDASPAAAPPGRWREGCRWSLIDFEGEPARPLSERREPQPVVRDIAGMLRSFDYAAATLTQASPGSTPDGDPAHARARRWAAASREAYCAGYAEAAGVDPRDSAALLRAFETDKAVYEVLYEARHRPSWLPIPLSAIRRLAGSPSDANG